LIARKIQMTDKLYCVIGFENLLLQGSYR